VSWSHELDDVAEAASLLLRPDRAVVALHGLGRVPTDRASNEVAHLRRAAEVLEGAAHAPRGDALVQADGSSDRPKRLVEHVARSEAAMDRRKQQVGFLLGSELTAIYLGIISRWSDPKIEAHNPSLKLPDAPIRVVRRSDGSGTTFNVTHYLSQVSREWKLLKAGSGVNISWPSGRRAKAPWHGSDRVGDEEVDRLHKAASSARTGGGARFLSLVARTRRMPGFRARLRAAAARAREQATRYWATTLVRLQDVLTARFSLAPQAEVPARRPSAEPAAARVVLRQVRAACVFRMSNRFQPCLRDDMSVHQPSPCCVRWPRGQQAAKTSTTSEVARPSQGLAAETPVHRAIAPRASSARPEPSASPSQRLARTPPRKGSAECRARAPVSSRR
jgi:hypothetical protein